MFRFNLAIILGIAGAASGISAVALAFQCNHTEQWGVAPCDLGDCLEGPDPICGTLDENECTQNAPDQENIWEQECRSVQAEKHCIYNDPINCKREKVFCYVNPITQLLECAQKLSDCNADVDQTTNTACPTGG